MAVLMKIEGWARPDPCPLEGLWVSKVDVQAASITRDWLWTTHDQNLAYRWPSLTAAMEKWREVLTSQPVRLHDGKPNRPLTAFHITFHSVED